MEWRVTESDRIKMKMKMKFCRLLKSRECSASAVRLFRLQVQGLVRRFVPLNLMCGSVALAMTIDQQWCRWPQLKPILTGQTNNIYIFFYFFIKISEVSLLCLSVSGLMISCCFSQATPCLAAFITWKFKLKA